MSNINTLKSWELGYGTVKEILADWFDVCEKDLMSTLCNDAIVSFWADNCNILTPELIDWIEASLDNRANFKIIYHDVVNNKMPVCELDLGAGIVIQLYYDFDC